MYECLIIGSVRLLIAYSTCLHEQLAQWNWQHCMFLITRAMVTGGIRWWIDLSLIIHTFANFSGAGDVWFSLHGTTYQNNSCVTLEAIGEGDDALLCLTNLVACCVRPYTGENGFAIGNWYFPNGTRVPTSGNQWGFFRTRGRMSVALNRIKGGVDGIYHCEIPDSMNVTQTINIWVYSASTSEFYVYDMRQNYWKKYAKLSMVTACIKLC